MLSFRGRYTDTCQQRRNSSSFRSSNAKLSFLPRSASNHYASANIQDSEVFDRLPFRPTKLRIDRGTWLVEHARNTVKLQGSVRITGLVRGQELFIPQIIPALHFIGDKAHDSFHHEIIVSKLMPGPGAAAEGSASSSHMEPFWSVPIVRHNETIEVLVDAHLRGSQATELKAAWIELNVEVYGPHGLETERQDIVLPLQTVAPLQQAQLPWKDCPHAKHVKTASIPTHLLTHLDSPVCLSPVLFIAHATTPSGAVPECLRIPTSGKEESVQVSIVRQYVSHLASDDHRDIVCIAESALAIMQGRWLHYKAVKPSWLARLGCRCFDPMSSMASACGLQAAIYLVGKIRVALGLVLGILSRLLGIRGTFYRTAGVQATAIDDLTGTLPPYDRFLVYGPVLCDQVVKQVQKETGTRCAVVDVNDKSAVTGGADPSAASDATMAPDQNRKQSQADAGLKVLAASPGVDTEKLMEALKHNPAGNAAEQTPVVLVRGIS